MPARTGDGVLALDLQPAPSGGVSLTHIRQASLSTGAQAPLGPRVPPTSPMWKAGSGEG